MRAITTSCSAAITRLCDLLCRHPFLAVIPAVIWYGISSVDFINCYVDDVFIPMRYAEHAAQGYGLVFNIGERVEGYSNFLWTALLTAAASAGINQDRSPYALLSFAKIAGFLCGLATILVATWLAVRISRESTHRSTKAMMVAAIISIPAASSFTLWSVSGMETPLCALFLILGASLHWIGFGREPAHKSRPYFLLGGIASALACLTRPEQMFAWGLMMVVLMMFVNPQQRRSLIPGAIMTTLVIIAFEVWRWNYYGEFLPNSVMAKSGGGIWTHLDGLRYGLAALAGSLGIAGLGLMRAVRLARRSSQWASLVLAAGAQLCFVAASSGDWMPGFRFLVPAIPLMCVVAYAGLADLLGEERQALHAPALLGIAILFSVGVYFNGRMLIRAQANYQSGLRGIELPQSKEPLVIAKDLNVIVPHGATVSMVECGEIAYFAPTIHVLDVLGLMDKEIARLPGRHMHGLTLEYFLSRNADYDLRTTHEDPSLDIVLADAEYGAHYQALKSFSHLMLFKRVK